MSGSAWGRGVPTSARAAGWKPPARGAGRSTASLTVSIRRARKWARSEWLAAFPASRRPIQSGTPEKISMLPTRSFTTAGSSAVTSSVIRVS